MAEKYVKFVGPYDYREITADQWSRAGVKDHPGTVWNAANNWRVLLSDLKLDDEQFQRIIGEDVYFAVTESDDRPSAPGQKYPAADT